MYSILLKFINSNPNWEDYLSNPPFNIKIKHEDEYVILKYSQLESDFSREIVRECRGLILKKENDKYRAVCVPFFKFGNYGESYADTIDWKSARVQEKVDGSLIKVWWDDDYWHVSTNGTIDAFNAPLNNGDFETFGDLFLYTLNKNGGGNLFNFLDKNYTFMFEMVGPANRVTIEYKDFDLYCLGCRNNITLEEEEVNPNIQDFGIKIPKTYSLSSLKDCISYVSSMGADEEGFVVVDKFYKRIKVKSPAYLAAARIRNNNVITKESVLELYLAGKIDDFYAYCADFKDFANEVIEDYNQFINNAILGDFWLSNQEFKDRKEFALLVKDSIYAPYLFKKLDNPTLTAKDYYGDKSAKKLISLIERSKNGT